MFNGIDPRDGPQLFQAHLGEMVEYLGEPLLDLSCAKHCNGMNQKAFSSTLHFHKTLHTQYNHQGEFLDILSMQRQKGAQLTLCKRQLVQGENNKLRGFATAYSIPSKTTIKQ